MKKSNEIEIISRKNKKTFDQREKYLEIQIDKIMREKIYRTYQRYKFQRVEKETNEII